MGESGLHFYDLGVGPVVLLLHGTPSPAEDLLPLANRLASRYRILVPDLPGYGRSPAPPDASFDMVGRQLVDALAARGVGELHAIVGYSGGAYRALHLALRLGVRVKVIAGIGALADLDAAARDGFRGLADLLDHDPSQIAVPPLHGMMAERSLSERWRATHPSAAAELATWWNLSAPTTLAAEFRAYAAMPSLLPELPRLEARVYLRVGELDVACPPDSSRAIAARVPGARLDVVPGCGHALLIEDADATMSTIEAALA